MNVDRLVNSYSFWTFSDIFEENHFPSMPFHGGFGLLNLHGIPKPVYSAFELLYGTGPELLPVSGMHETVSAWVTRRGNNVTVLLTNQAIAHHPIVTVMAHVRLSEARQPHSARMRRIDEEHANPVALWISMGEPEYLSTAEVEKLQASSCLVNEPCPLKYANQILELDASSPPESVAAIDVVFGTDLSEGDGDS